MLTRFTAVIATAAFVGGIVLPRALAQPEPSFRTSCAGLRGAIEKLNRSGEGLITIQVEGALRNVFDGALAYLLLCTPPDPQVLCITYSTGGRKTGDKVVLTGNFSQRGADHVLLDSCLPSPPGP